MVPVKFFFCTFDQNLISKVQEEEPADGTAFIFPTESSKALAMRRFQPQWEFSDTQFLTIEELKELTFLTDKPLLKEEKRTLAFYSALSEDDRKFFRVSTYFQSIEFAAHFFELWEEFNEELLAPGRPPEKFADDENFLPWQRETYRRLLSIREQYQRSIAARNFSDEIFIRHPRHFNPSFFDEFQRIIFVNQFYYTELEKFILQKFIAAGKEVRLYYQLPEDAVDKNTLSVRHFEISEIGAVRTKQIFLFEAPNHFSMLLKFFEIAREKGVNHVIDVAFHDQAYARFLSAAKFRVTEKIRFTETTLYRLLQILSDVVKSLTFDPKRQDFLLPLQSILDAALNEEAFHFIMGNREHRDAEFSREKILNEIYGLIGDDFRFVDFQGRFFSVREFKNGRDFIAPLLRILRRLIKIKSIDDLLHWLNHPQFGIDPEQVCSDFELKNTDIRKVYFQALGDFISIEQTLFDEQKNWGRFFGSDSRSDAPKLAGGLLRLLVDYLKAKRISFHSQAGENGANDLISISNLEDTRNLSYSQVAVWNVSEDVIPAPRKPVFLFTENQRRRLGLKTYEEIRAQERYYFFRLVFNAEHVYLFSLKNIDQNTDVSSFVEELKIFRSDLCADVLKIEDKFYKEAYRTLLAQAKSPLLGDVANKNFFRLPHKKTDFPDDIFELSYYHYADLTENLFFYFLKYFAALEEPVREVSEDFTSKFLGNFAHDVLNRMWRKIIEEQGALSSGYDFSKISLSAVRSAIREARNSETNYYKFPQNYARIYFEEILSEIYAQQILVFFEKMEKLFQGKNILVFPEKDFSSPEESNAKTLISEHEGEVGVEVRIKGRGDLRIEDHSSQPVEFHIFDYKTGNGGNIEQLLFYELFYYLIEKKAMPQDVHSYFFHVMDAEMKSLQSLLKKKNKEEQIDLIKETILDAVRRIQREGFSLPNKRSLLTKMNPITRGDLFLKQKARAHAGSDDDSN